MAAVAPKTNTGHDLGTSDLRWGTVYAGNMNASGNVTISGNLNVIGNASEINVDNLSVAEPLIKLADGNSADTLDIGIFAQYNDGSDKYSVIYRDATDGKWKIVSGLTNEPTPGSDISLAGLEATTLVVDVLESNALTGVDADGDITIEPNGSGSLLVNSTKLRLGDNDADSTITTRGTGDLTLNTNDGTNSGTIVIADGAHGNITITPNGTGQVNVASGLAIGGVAVTSTAAELNILDGVTATAAELNALDGITADVNELNILDGVTATAAELNILDGVTASTAELNYLDVTTLGTSEDSKAVTQNSDGTIVIGATNGDQTIDIASHDLVDGGLKLGGTLVTSSAAELNILDGVTATTAELNILDGVTATAAELNALDGITADVNELNILDGVTATTAELNILDGVTATTAELNYLDVTTLGTSEDSKAVTQNSDGTIVIGATNGNQTIDIASHDLVDGGLKLGGTLVTSSAAELNILDGVTATTAELNILDGVTATAAELNALDGITADVNELNILDGVTATTADLNILDGVTATALEISLLDGSLQGIIVNSKAVIYGANGEVNATKLQLSGDDITSNADELNILDGVTATTAELNYLDITTLGTAQASKAVTVDASSVINFNNIDMTNVDIDSGAIDGTAIGANSASSAEFTTLQASSNSDFTGDVDISLDSGTAFRVGTTTNLLKSVFLVDTTDGSPQVTVAGDLVVNESITSGDNESGSLLIKGGVRYDVDTTKTATGSLATSEHLICADATAGAIVLTLPANGARDGHEYILLRKADGQVDTHLKLQPPGAENLYAADGATTYTNGSGVDIPAKSSLRVIFDGTSWYIV